MQGLSAGHEYLRFVVTLTAVVDPFLAVPFFITFTRSFSESERRALARVVALTVLAVLAVSTFVGDALLGLMGAISSSILAAEKGGIAHQLVLVACIAFVCVLTWLALIQAHAIAARLGTTGLNIATRILGLLLAAMAVQTMAEGLKALFPGLA